MPLRGDVASSAEREAAMPEERPVTVVVFDVNETLLDIVVLEPLFERVFGHAGVMREWFAQLILYSQTLTLAGRYTPFGELAVGTFRMVASIHGVTPTDDHIADLEGLMRTMPAHPDAVPALTLLRDAGFRLVTLTNSAGASSPTPLERAGLAGFFERSFSVEAVRQFKPAPAPYRLVAQAIAGRTVRAVPGQLPCVGHDWRPGGRLPGCAGDPSAQRHPAGGGGAGAGPGRSDVDRPRRADHRALASVLT